MDKFLFPSKSRSLSGDIRNAQTMTNSEKVYIALCIVFSVLIVVGNLIYKKFVSIPMGLISPLEVSIGIILYPLTFLITDLISEFYGKIKATFCIKMAIGMNALMALAIVIFDSLEATPWSVIDGVTFHKVFGHYTIAFLTSLFACYVAQRLDVSVYLWIRNITGNKWLWLRNNCSTALSLILDTALVIGFLTLFGVLPREHAESLFINSCLFKLIFAICSTPLFYICFLAIKSVVVQPQLMDPPKNISDSNSKAA